LSHQRAHHAADLLPESQVIAGQADEAFAAVNDRPRCALDSLARLTDHLRHVIDALHCALPDPKVILREHRLSWRREPNFRRSSSTAGWSPGASDRSPCGANSRCPVR
jgi:hypothetical protein